MKFVLLALAALLVGCQTVVQYDPNTGKKISSTPQDVAAMQSMVAIVNAKTKQLQAIAMLDKQAQNTMMIRGDLWTDEMRSYTDGEKAETAMISDVTGKGLWGLLGYGLLRTMGDMADNAGDRYSVGDVHQNKSDDPIGGGEGSRMTVDSGSQNLNIGSGRITTARDQGIADSTADKLITVPNPNSSFDGNGNPSGIQIEDPDGNNNDASLF